ncbi:MAG: primosomal protein N' [Gammaproteobacteria bacterium]|nr:primosomal protein N' [Gammaproteobacteria bacterium]MDH3766871.1 primosomal protein N' [Gammaproteobacteria bacterium]
MNTPQRIIRVAIKTPLNNLFDYLPPASVSGAINPGVRVLVPFGRAQTVGIVVETADSSAIPTDRLRRIVDVLDTSPVLDKDLMTLLAWAAGYYQQTPGEVYAAALPRLLRDGRQIDALQDVWSSTPSGRDIEIEKLRRRAPRQASALSLLLAHPDGADVDLIERAMGDGWRPIVRTLVDKEWAVCEQRRSVPETILGSNIDSAEETPQLTDDQENAVVAVDQSGHQFAAFLLHGVTGSGKTEVYLQLIEKTLQKQQQALVLAPEIGLTPQLVDRFRRRLDVPLAVLHSGLTDSERLNAWRTARCGSARVVVGTRSAVFAPLESPGIVIVDEEHDTSYKQQEGFRYSARDLAVMRARQQGIPVVLGSATPSLESLHNVNQGRYTQLDLRTRAGGASMPSMRLLDMRREPIDGGLSGSLIGAMRQHLQQSGQVLLFLNRRGFAPVWFCPDCTWAAACARCDARMTLHQSAHQLRCHHCGATRSPEPTCPECDGAPQPVGMGTQRIEETIDRLFPDHALARIDRDSTRRRGSMEHMLEEIRHGDRRILIGTQMLTKGHHFPAVTLVGVIDADQGLFGTDPRSSERLAQLLVQVAGRAGRAKHPGEVLIQTQCPEHPLLNTLIHHGYRDFAKAALREREAAGWPPYTALALLRADSEKESLPPRFLNEARHLAGNIAGITILGPAAAPMPRRAGRFRAQLLIQGDRGPLQSFLSRWTPQLSGLNHARRVRWSLDVDPLELF